MNRSAFRGQTPKSVELLQSTYQRVRSKPVRHHHPFTVLVKLVVVLVDLSGSVRAQAGPLSHVTGPKLVKNSGNWSQRKQKTELCSGGFFAGCN